MSLQPLRNPGRSTRALAWLFSDRGLMTVLSVIVCSIGVGMLFSSHAYDAPIYRVALEMLSLRVWGALLAVTGLLSAVRPNKWTEAAFVSTAVAWASALAFAIVSPGIGWIVAVVVTYVLLVFRPGRR